MGDLRGQTCAFLIPALLAAALSGCAGDGGAAADDREATDDQAGPLTAGPVNVGTAQVMVHLKPRSGVSGNQRVNFAVPLPRDLLTNVSNVRVRRAGVDLAIGKRALALYPGGSIRSVQIQFDLQVSGETDVEVRIGEASPVAGIALVPVANTLVANNGAQIPRVWAVLPAAWLSASGVTGPQVTEASVAGTPLAAWNDLCDYETNDVDSFLAQQSNGAVWLYDRGTTMYRGYARLGAIGPLASAYRETSIYRSGITGSGSSTDIGVPGKQGDLKYFYAQNMAIHYLLTGDDRFRESAEQIAGKVGDLWEPWYNGNMWTERNAGFMLLAYVWASIVSDNRAAEFAALANDVVDAALDLQADDPPGGYANANARCYAHSADAHGEDYGYWGCSPWMSAILADGLDAYASERTGARQTAARQSIVKLGRILAAQGRDGDGRPFYWMGVGTSQDEPDDYEEHWGESAYVIAMAWYHGGKSEPALKTAADQIVQGFINYGEAPHMRSFNWQCRSAVATPFYLK
jgi:hypothetical protein